MSFSVRTDSTRSVLGFALALPLAAALMTAIYASVGLIS